MQGTADVLVDVGNVVQIALSVGEASIGAAILTDSAELMGIRVPQLIAGGVDDVPAEPPVPHRGRDARHVGTSLPFGSFFVLLSTAPGPRSGWRHPSGSRTRRRPAGPRCRRPGSRCANQQPPRARPGRPGRVPSCR